MPEDRPWLLYDNQADPYQKHNLIGNSRYRDVQAALDWRLEARLKAAGVEFLPGAALHRTRQCSALH
jgi:hypothetical protein